MHQQRAGNNPSDDSWLAQAEINKMKAMLGKVKTRGAVSTCACGHSACYSPKPFQYPSQQAWVTAFLLRSASVGSRVQSAGLAAAASLAVGAALLHPAAMPAPGSGVTWLVPCDSAAL